MARTRVRVRVRSMLLFFGGALVVFGVLWTAHTLATSSGSPLRDWRALIVGVAAIVFGFVDVAYALRNPDR